MRFGTDGVRGRANSELTAALALNMGRAAARVLGADRVVIGGDSRRSTPMLEAALVAGFATEGAEVIRVGVAPTPMVAFEAARRNAMGAVVSASHNPYHDNGVKFFAVGGTKLSDAVERAIEAEFDDLIGGDASDADPGIVHGRTDPQPYIDHLISALEGRSLDGLKLVVDAANGAASHIAYTVFERTGAEVVVICDRPDGVNINARCGATDVTGLQAAVREHGADVGLALDGDADRLIAVDANGAVVDGDHLIAICAIDMYRRGLLVDDTVVVTVMANLGFKLSMENHGISVLETAVGDRYVLEALNQYGLSIGGEQSGHVIFPSHATTGDGMLTGLMVLDVVARSGRPLADLAGASMTQLPQVMINVSVAERRPDIASVLAAEIAAAEAELGATGRVLVRPSGTEPLVRVMVEALNDHLARSTAENLVVAVRNLSA